MNKKHQKVLLSLLADKEQMSGGGFIQDEEADGVVFAYWPPVGRHEVQIKELISWCVDSLPGLHPSIRVETAFSETCMSIHCRFEDVDYDRMDLKADLTKDMKARIRTEAVVEEVRAQLISLVENMYPEPKAEGAANKLGM